VFVEAVIDMMFGFVVSFPAVLAVFTALLVPVVWFEAAFLLRLAGHLQSRKEIYQARKFSLSQEYACGFDNSAPQQFVRWPTLPTPAVNTDAPRKSCRRANYLER